MIITEETEGLFRFIVYIFAIIGGGFTAFGLFDSVWFHSDRILHMADGRIVSEIDPREITVPELEERIYA